MTSDSKTPLFVVGVGRSGTSLLQLILASHPEISFLPEIRFVRRFLLQDRLSQIARQRGMGAIRELFETDDKLRRLTTSPEQLTLDLTAEDLDRRIFARIYDHYADSKTRFVGYKDPRLIEDLDRLAKTWPAARFVHIYRDPRDVLVSRKTAEWSMNHPLWRNLVAGKFQLDTASRFALQTSPQRFHELKYENLITKPQETVQRLCEYLKLEFTPEMLQYRHRADELVFADEKKWKQNLFSPVLSGNSGKWRDGLSAVETCAVESVFKQDFNKRGYEFSGLRDTLKLAQRLRVKQLDLLVRLVAAGYRTKQKMYR